MMWLGRVRTTVEHIARGKTFWRRLPKEFDRKPLKVSPDSALRYLKIHSSNFDPMLLRLAEEHVVSGTKVWDIGANVGVFSLAAAAKGGEVLGVEPDPWLYSLLFATSQHRENSDLVFDPLCAAISSAPGIAQLQIANRGRSANFLEEFQGSSQSGGVREQRLVPVLNLDTLLEQRLAPDLVKIDVEGAEFAVMQGAKRLINDVRPKFLIEVVASLRGPVLGNLIEKGYEITDFETNRSYSDKPDDGFNFLALPN